MTDQSGYLLMHAAIRVELDRLAEFAVGLAAGRRRPGPRQLTALRDHVADVIGTIHHHHTGEDGFLWPMLREAVGPTAELAALSGDHGELDPLMDRIKDALERLAAGGVAEAPARRLAEAAVALRDLMVEHLAEEEAVVVPIVAAHIGPERHAAMEKAMRKALPIKMGFALPWVMAADAVLAERVARSGGLLLRLIHATTRGRYARRVQDAYADLAPAERDVALSARAEVVIPAPPGDVYAAVADVTRMGRWSPECYRCAWDDAATGAVPGARFRGSSRSGIARWTRECVVITAEPGVEFAFRTLRRGRYPDSTTWRFALTEVPGGTRLVQTMALSAGRGIMAFERISGRDRKMPHAMAATLERIRADLAGRVTAAA
ncbi:hemerythrin domain-containing protein [Dactylosporangium aurantiacum]|uniref:Hemerythrin domain-containing protein n=1 Tax=Dactylosporangium aurantiacum TaxID=35754 RepID=A0A9Q9MCZ0_9ACTN|nr:hemerythrin domain-containing protein [Dactylosporangium aurantiacum]MDG6107195.1 hemerythrin domain-containing protein [Dactylosporangium aurantiacum]UWZ51489.1 hemerythrin domain-containing protein [Dactylosporangium aurantiacum]